MGNDDERGIDVFDDARGAIRRLALLVVIGALAIAAAACGESVDDTGGAQGAAASDRGTTLIIAVAGDPETLDAEWGQAARANETIKNLYAQWVKYKTVDSGEGYQKADLPNVEGEVLESIEQDDDGTVRMKVRPDAKFPDGSPITADDLIYKVRRSLEMQAGSIFDFNIIGVTEMSQVKKISDSEIEFKLPQASPILGPMLRDQDAGIVDTKSVKEHSTKKDEWGTEWVARNAAPTGAYTIAENKPGSRLVLKANPSYWGEEPYFKEVILQIVPSADERMLLLREGKVDIAEDLSIEAASRLKGQDGVNVLSVPSINQDLLGFVMDKPPFDDPLVRQAVAYAIPYEDLAQGVLQGEAKVPKGVWPQNSIWFENADWPYAHDPEKAKQLLAQAGHADGLEFTVEIKDSDADAAALAVPIQTALKDVGIDMRIDKLSASKFTENIGEKSMQAWIQSNLGSYVDDPYYQTFLWFGTQSVLNWFKYSNPKIDKAIEQFATVLPEDEKRALAAEVQAELNNDLPAISLGEPNFLLPMRDDIEGFLYEPDGLVTYRTLKRSG
jgi:peptide/nickel transport system substrate-binding protein